MSLKRTKTIAFAMGTTTGGMVTGLLEALYRDASLIYALFLYSALGAAAGLATLPLLKILPKTLRPERLGSAGAALTLLGTTTVIGRFLLIRDVFEESAGANVPASIIALLAGLVAAVGVYSIGKAFGQNFRSDKLNGWPAWTLVASVLLGFGFLSTQTVTTTVHNQPPIKDDNHKVRGTILVVADALRADALSIYGATSPQSKAVTPNIHKWAQSAVVFDDMSAQASWTKPAMASMMTSRHVAGHQTMLKTDTLPQTLETMAEVLTAGKVQTGAVVTNYNLEKSYGFSAGFTNYRYLAPDRYLGAPADANRLVAYNVYRLIRERYMSQTREARFFYQGGQVVNQAAFEFLDQRQDTPFFLWLHYMEPHDPFFSNDGQSYARVATPAPPSHMAKIYHDAYRDDVQRFDQAFGEMLEGLRKRNLLDDVHIILTSDHGEEFNEHGGYYHGQTLYEEMLNIPLVISGPAVTPARRSDVARQIDIAPTIAGLFGLKPNPNWEGRNLLGDTAPPAHTFASQNHQGQILEAARQTNTVGMKIITANQDNPRGLAPIELYELGADSQERTNLGDDNPTAVQTLLDELKIHDKQSLTGGADRQQKSMKPEDEAELRSLGYIE